MLLHRPVAPQFTPGDAEPEHPVRHVGEGVVHGRRRGTREIRLHEHDVRTGGGRAGGGRASGGRTGGIRAGGGPSARPSKGRTVVAYSTVTSSPSPSSTAASTPSSIGPTATTTPSRPSRTVRNRPGAMARGAALACAESRTYTDSSPAAAASRSSASASSGWPGTCTVQPSILASLEAGGPGKMRDKIVDSNANSQGTEFLRLVANHCRVKDKDDW